MYVSLLLLSYWGCENNAVYGLLCLLDLLNAHDRFMEMENGKCDTPGIFIEREAAAQSES